MALLCAQCVLYIISALLKRRSLSPRELWLSAEGPGAPNLDLSNSKARGQSRPVQAERT